MTQSTSTPTTLTISAGLRRAKRLKGRLGTLSSRAASSVCHVEEKAPAFEFDAARKELASAREELIGLRASIGRANALTKISWEKREMSLAEAIVRLQEFKAEISWLQSLRITEGTETDTEVDYDEDGRRIRREVKVTWVTKLTEVDRASQIESLSDKFESLNAMVEAANHSTKLE